MNNEIIVCGGYLEIYHKIYDKRTKFILELQNKENSESVFIKLDLYNMDIKNIINGMYKIWMCDSKNEDNLNELLQGFKFETYDNVKMSVFYSDNLKSYGIRISNYLDTQQQKILISRAVLMDIIKYLEYTCSIINN